MVYRSVDLVRLSSECDAVGVACSLAFHVVFRDADGRRANCFIGKRSPV